MLLWPQSSHPPIGNGRALDPISQPALPITPHIPHGHLPSLSGCFGCEASVAAPLSPIPSTAWLSCSFPRSFCLSLLPPPSLPLLSCWALAFSSLLCVSGPPLQPDLVHIQMAAKVLRPLPPPTQAQGTQPCGELLLPHPLSSSSLWAINIEVSWALGLCHLSPSDMTRCVILGKSQPPLASVFPMMGRLQEEACSFQSRSPLGVTCDL